MMLTGGVFGPRLFSWCYLVLLVVFLLNFAVKTAYP